MIKDIFLPEKINSFYLFTQRIVAFEVGTNYVCATVMRAHRNKRSFQKFLFENFDPSMSDSLQNTITVMLQQIGAYDAVYIALPSSLAVFKTLDLPFTSLEKIKLVVPFEVEPLLPFSLQDAVIDTVINHIDTQEKKSNVFVVAMKRSTLETALQPFINAGVRPQKVTVGPLELYSCLKEYKFIDTAAPVSFIIDIHQEKTNILLLIQGRLQAIRTLPLGISHELSRLDVASHDSPVLQQFFSKVQFTVQAMLKNEKITNTITSVLLSGIGAHLAGITTAISALLECPCMAFHPNKILHNSIITLDQEGSIAPEFTTVVATALSSSTTQDFNLDKVYENVRELHIFKRQVITSLTLLLTLFVALFLYSFFTIRSLRNEVNQSQEQVVKELNREFDLGVKNPKSVKSLSSFMQQAESKLLQEESIWFALSNTQRYSFLRYLQELSTRINRDATGLQMKRLILKRDDRTGEDRLTLEGSVRDYAALQLLEEGLLETQLFTYVPKQQEPKFNIHLLIDKNREETA